ncbi:MAG: beta-1,6-N-acetylglucosaminyltransferase [Rhodobacterales bacterium]|nr:beta-1,6-N-acetylglucosaminyltransferase [Rhodobacterales bacterium]NCT12397.1 beta-1,6-N-acetylglucosaminyltransferase [Rhodobacterales bacterium]
MAKIAFILLCHKDPDAIIQQAQQLTAAGDCMAIHFDARAPIAAYDRIRAALADNPNVTFARRRIKCGWGEWSLVQATLNAVQAAADAFPRATHFYMVSGDCMAIKSAVYAHKFLDAEDADYIESVDFFDSDWIKTGMKEDRLHYRHFFNERTQKKAFYWALDMQRRLGLRREVPADIQVMIGSQWWCLRRRTIEWILDFTRQRPDVMRFFRTTWIPDETFFQTLVRHLVPEGEIRSRTLTFLMFTEYGMPVTFYNDHYDLLLAQDFLFARKISPEAITLKKRLGLLYASDRDDFKISNEGRRLFTFLTGRGRIGRRFAPRFWETETSLGRERELLIIACKKWHVAKRLVGAIRTQTNIPAIDYLFNEESTPLPDLGGIQSTLAKRTRHRRALMRMLFDYYETDRLLICLDTANLDLMQDFFSDRSTTRLLEIECRFTDDYLIGHAMRVGLAGEQTSPETLAQLLPTIRYDVVFESDRIRDANFASHLRLREGASVDENTAPLAAFLGLPPGPARALADTPYLFND